MANLTIPLCRRPAGVWRGVAELHGWPWISSGQSVSFFLPRIDGRAIRTSPATARNWTFYHAAIKASVLVKAFHELPVVSATNSSSYHTVLVFLYKYTRIASTSGPSNPLLTASPFATLATITTLAPGVRPLSLSYSLKCLHPLLPPLPPPLRPLARKWSRIRLS